MEMTLLLLFFGGLWAHMVHTESPEISIPREPSFSLAPNISEASNLNSVGSDPAITRVPEDHGRTGQQVSLPSSAPYEESSLETSIAADVSLITNAITTQEVPTRNLSMFQEISNATSHHTVPAMTNLYLHTTAGKTMPNSSLETSSGMLTSESPVTMATSSLEPSSGTSGLPATMTTSSLETSDVTSGPPITMVTGSLETSNGTSGLPVTMATSSLETPQETSGSPILSIKILTTSAISTNKGSRPAQSSDQKTKNSLVVAVLVALLVVIILLALILLWRRRQKQRTGALTLNRGGKRNGVVDAWAGPARVSDEETVITAAGVPGGDKGIGIPEGEGSGRRPTLTTFFGRRKSHQGSLALEELKAEPAPSLTGEEEPLVGSEDGAVEAPASNGPEAGEVEVPSCL